MNLTIRICYVDNDIDYQLQEYLLSNYHEKDYKTYYTDVSEVCFNNSTQNYRDLLLNEDIKQSNILIIDSRLFENNSTSNGKLTGEKFKLILKKIYPFIKVIVITQHPIVEGSSNISKFKEVFRDDGDEILYYEKHLKPILEKHFIEIVEEYSIMDELNLDSEIDPVLSETIENTIKGLETYSDFDLNKLDELIKLFQSVKEKIDDGAGL